MTRLSCHWFRSNQVRLVLNLLAYNLGNLWQRLALPANRELVADESAATSGENRTQRLFASMVRRAGAAVANGIAKAVANRSVRKDSKDGVASEVSATRVPEPSPK